MTLLQKAVDALQAEMEDQDFSRIGTPEDPPGLVVTDPKALVVAVLKAVREIPDGFIRERREMFYSTEFLEYDFATLVEAILADGGG